MESDIIMIILGTTTNLYTGEKATVREAISKDGEAVGKSFYF